MCDDDIHQRAPFSQPRRRCRAGPSACRPRPPPPGRYRSATMAHAAGHGRGEGRRREDARRHRPTRRSLSQGQGQLAGGADLDRHRRPAPGLPRHGPAARRPGLCRAGAQSVLPRRTRAAITEGHRLRQARGPRQAHGPGRPRWQARARHRARRARLPRLPRRPAADQQEEEGRDPGLLHGRPAGLPHRRDPARPHRRRRSPSMAAAWSPRSRPARTC